MDEKIKFTLGRAYFVAFTACLITNIGMPAQANNVDVGAALKTRQVITLDKVEDMNFGLIDYQAGYSGQIILGSDSQVSATGTGLAVSGGSPQAGQVNVSGDSTSTIELTCSLTGAMADAAGRLIPLLNTEYALDTGVPSGSGTGCAGVGNAPTLIDFSAQANSTLLLGATADFSSATALSGNADYTSANAGGTPITIQAVYQ